MIRTVEKPLESMLRKRRQLQQRRALTAAESVIPRYESSPEDVINNPHWYARNGHAEDRSHNHAAGQSWSVLSGW